MFRDVSIGRYIPAESPVHRLDARVKLLAGFALAVALFAVRTWAGFGVIALYIAAAARAARLPAGYLVRGLRPLAVLLLVTSALHALLTDGTVLWSFGPLRVTREGLEAAGFFSLRLVLLLTGLSLVTLTTSPLAMTDAVAWLLAPGARLGLPAHEIAMMMTIALRFVPTLMEELDRIIKAQLARGAVFDRGGPAARVRALLPLLVPMFISAFRRAEELGVAMEARCYRGGYGRTRWREARQGPADWAALAVSGLLMAFVAWRM